MIAYWLGLPLLKDLKALEKKKRKKKNTRRLQGLKMALKQLWNDQLTINLRVLTITDGPRRPETRRALWGFPPVANRYPEQMDEVMFTDLSCFFFFFLWQVRWQSFVENHWLCWGTGIKLKGTISYTHNATQFTKKNKTLCTKQLMSAPIYSSFARTVCFLEPFHMSVYKINAVSAPADNVVTSWWKATQIDAETHQ